MFSSFFSSFLMKNREVSTVNLCENCFRNRNLWARVQGSCHCKNLIGKNKTCYKQTTKRLTRDKMTKMMEWVAVLAVLFGVWFSFVTNKVENNFYKNHYDVLLFSPIIFVFLFGLYALTVVLYRTFTFNNCEEAAEELQKEIQEAKTELSKLGYKFKEVKA